MSSVNSGVIKCEDCKHVFSQRKNLYAHMRRFHNKEPISKKKENNNILCNSCSKLFGNKRALLRHIKNSHNEDDHNYSNPTKNGSRLLCPIDDCNERFSRYRSLDKHLNLKHSFKVETEYLEFNSVEDFQTWKDEFQQQSLSRYVSDTAPTRLSGDIKKQYLHCHRSFVYKPKGKNIRRLKSTGSNKLGKACPSRMEVTTHNKNKSVVKVTLFKSHCGHALQLEHIFLDKQSKSEIAGKLREGASLNHVLDSIKDDESHNRSSNKRLARIDRKDLHNIIRDFNIDYSTKRCQNDALSVKLWVQEMTALGEYCPVLYYKGQNEKDSETLLKIDDFVLILMTDFQAAQLAMFGSDKICVHGTHGTNQYDIQLYTLVTVDEFGEGCPVAYCFSNRSDELIFTLYYRKIKEKIGIISTKVFMSDDAPAFYNAWVSVMGLVEQKLSCTWHVDRNWRTNLNKITGGTVKQALVYKTLRALLRVISVEDFHSSLKTIVKELLEDGDTKDFGQYFQSHYAQRPQSWAYCYWRGLGITTNKHLESFHRKLKHIYLEGRKVKSLATTINDVMKFARDSLLMKITKNSDWESRHHIKASHRSGESISSDLISVNEEGNEWLVTSITDPSKKYHVVYNIKESCSELCLKCDRCKICIHSYTCSCIDNLIKMNICKHIHACSQFNFEGSNRAMSPLSESLDTMLDIDQANADPDTQNISIIKKAEMIIGLSNKVHIEDNERIKIEKYLDKVISLMNEADAVSLHITEHINVQEIDWQYDKEKEIFVERLSKSFD